MIITESIEAYHATDPLSASGMKELLRSAAHFRWYQDAPDEEPTPAQHFGTLCHLALIEPRRFQESFIVAPDVDRRTKAGKQIWEDFQAALLPTQFVVKAKEADAIVGMIRSVQSHPTASRLLTSGVAEQSIYFEMLGVDVKTRPDYVNTSEKAVIDLKTTMDAGYDGFQKQMSNLDYPLQAYLQYRGVEVELGWKDHINAWVCVEKDPPYAVAVYVPDDTVLARGRVMAEKALLRYKQCVDSGEWKAYGDDPIGMQLPPWQLNDPELIGSL